MRRFRCHKIVDAAKIEEVDHYKDRVRVEGGEWFTMPLMGVRLQIGWYLVRYGDGYLSASPPEPFEQGYTLVDAARSPIHEFAAAILHGDDDHREWLNEAANAWVAGTPLPAPRGKGVAA